MLQITSALKLAGTPLSIHDWNILTVCIYQHDVVKHVEPLVPFDFGSINKRLHMFNLYKHNDLNYVEVPQHEGEISRRN